MRARTLLQSMRTYSDFEDFEVLGSQYEYEDGIEWHVAVWSESERLPWRSRIARGASEVQLLPGKHLEAVNAAIKAWEADPVWAD
jgi:hypothetical protein